MRVRCAQALWKEEGPRQQQCPAARRGHSEPTWQSASHCDVTVEKSSSTGTTASDLASRMACAREKGDSESGEGWPRLA